MRTEKEKQKREKYGCDYCVKGNICKAKTKCDYADIIDPYGDYETYCKETAAELYDLILDMS